MVAAVARTTIPFDDILCDEGAERLAGGILEISIQLADGRCVSASPSFINFMRMSSQAAAAMAQDVLMSGVGYHCKFVMSFEPCEYLTPEEAGARLGVSRQTIYTWQDRGRLGRQDRGIKRMVPLDDVLRLANDPVRNAIRAAAAKVDPDEPEPPLTDEDVAALREVFG